MTSWMRVFRGLLATPRFFVPSVVVQALGIGVLVTVFAFLYAISINPLPLPESGRLVCLYNNYLGMDITQVPMTPGDYREMERTNSLFDAMAATQEIEAKVSFGSTQDLKRCLLVTSSLQRTLRVSPRLGRWLDAAGDTEGGPLEAMLLYEYWATSLGKDPAWVGRSMWVNGRAYMIVGILPPDLHVSSISQGEAPIAWCSMAMPQSLWANHMQNLMSVVARVKDQYDPDRLGPLLERESEAVAAAGGLPSDLGLKISSRTLKDAIIGDQRTLLSVVFGIVMLVFVMASANAASLTLARQVKRRKELAIQAALGASWRHLIGRAVVESQIIALLGTLCGLGVAWSAIRLIQQAAPGIPRLHEVALSLPVIGFAFAASLMSVLLAGILPALGAIRNNLGTVLREDGPGGGGLRHRTRRLLVVSQVCIALLALLGTGVLIRGYQLSLRLSSGGRLEHLYQLPAMVGGEGEESPLLAANRALALQRAIEEFPGVRRTALTSSLPLEGELASTTFEIEGIPPGDKPSRTDFRYVSSSYPDVSGVKLLDGRMFKDSEGSSVAVVNSAFVKQHFPGMNPIGRILQWGRPVQIIGVVSDVRNRGLETPAFPELFLPIETMPSVRKLFVLLDASGKTPIHTPTLQKRIAALNLGIAVGEASPLRPLLQARFKEQRFWSATSTALGVIAILVVAAGIYSLYTYLVDIRGRELAVRAAIGAEPRHLFRVIFLDGILLTAGGVVCGLVLLPAFLYGMRGILPWGMVLQPALILSCVGLLAVIAALACFPSALQASRADSRLAIRDRNT